jgi:hypothetical protein
MMGLKAVGVPEDVVSWIIGSILIVYLVVRVSQLFSRRRGNVESIPPGTAREYGLGGGAICPRCRRPFRLSLLDLKIGLGYKVARCKNCGKVSVVRRIGLDELRQAEAAELSEVQAAPQVAGKSPAEKLQDDVDASRFTDSV